MLDVMNDQDLRALAAEFVLGTLDPDERARANELLNSDDQFRGLVGTWERRFGELHLMVEPVEPPPSVWQRIRGKVTGVEPTPEAKSSEALVAPPPATPSPEPELTLDALEAELRRAGVAGAEPAHESSVERLGPATETPAVLAAEAVLPVRAKELALAPAVEPPSGVRQSLRRWRLAAVLTTLVAAALAGLIAAWRYAPEQLPPQLRAADVLNMRAPESRPAPVRPTAPPDSRFDE
jgi:anti-sigma-K factor RskA